MKRTSIAVLSIAFLFVSIAVVLINCSGGGGGGGVMFAAAAGPGQIFIPVPDSSGDIALPDGVSTNVKFNVGKPIDYAGGTVTYGVVLSGCDGSDMRIYLEYKMRAIGSNSTLQIIAQPSTYSMPAKPDLTHYNIVYISDTVSNFNGDYLEIGFSRVGADANDTCTGAASVHGAIVEYPR